MTRLMMTLATVFALALFAGPLAADDAARENARKFVEAQSSINEAVLGEHSFDMRILGQTVGTIELTIEKAEMDGAECYKLTFDGRAKIGVEMRQEGVEYLRPDLGVIGAETKQFTGDELEKHTVIERVDGKVKVTVKRPQDDDESRRETVAEYEPEPTQLFGSAGMMVYALLPQVPGNYEFDDYDTDAGKFGLNTVEAKGEVEKFGGKAFRMQVTSVNFEEDDDGEFTESEEETETFVWEGKLLHMEDAEGMVLTTGPEREFTPITREQIEKQEDAVAVAAGFFLAFQEKDADLLRALINEEEFMYNFFDNDPDMAGMPEEEKRAYARMAAPELVKGILEGKPEPEDENEAEQQKAFTKLILNREHFDVEKTDEGYRSRFTEEAARHIGNFTMGIWKNDETGKFEIVLIDEDGDEGEDAEDQPEEQPDEEPEAPAPDEDEDEFARKAA